MSGTLDTVNAYFRRFYPADWADNWETEPGAGGYWRRYTGDRASNGTIFPSMVCADGFTMSVQGHFGAYSWPRDDFAEAYETVEILGPDDIAEFARFRDAEVGEERLYAYVPVRLVCEVIEAHGGLRDATRIYAIEPQCDQLRDEPGTETRFVKCDEEEAELFAVFDVTDPDAELVHDAPTRAAAETWIAAQEKETVL